MNETAMNEFDSLKLFGMGRAFKAELINMVAATYMFRDFDGFDIEDLSKYLQAYEATKGTVLFREGDKGSYMCLLFKGRVEIQKEDSSGVLKVMAVVGNGRTFGEMAIIDGQPRSASAVVTSPATLGILTKNNFQRIVEEKPTLSMKVLLKISSLLSQRLRLTSGILVDYLES